MSLALDTKQDTLRDNALEAAKQHKASWLRLGQFLFTIYKDKQYKNWGYLTFEAYCIKELHLKQATASKLLKSYHFLEKEEPRLVQTGFSEQENPRQIPSYEAVNLLRIAKQNKDLTPRDIAEVRESVFDKGKEPKEVRAQVKKLMDQYSDKDPDEERQARRKATIKRMISILKNAHAEFKQDEVLPKYLLKQVSDLVSKLEDQLQ